MQIEPIKMFISFPAMQLSQIDGTDKYFTFSLENNC